MRSKWIMSIARSAVIPSVVHRCRVNARGGSITFHMPLKTYLQPNKCCGTELSAGSENSRCYERMGTRANLCVGATSRQAINTVPSEMEMAAYLMVYFSDLDHSLHMALSSDGYSFTALNENKPVVDGKEIAEQKGIRDPHITRGPDGVFYLAMTDLHIFARREGFRESQWERDGNRYGWGNNRGFVLMKSKDLIHWSHANVRVDKAFEGYDEVGCAWAPETIYDPVKKQMMLYFTMRFGNGQNKVYYTYMNKDFDAMLTKPEWVDREDKSCEAPNVWKRIGEDKWVLMYDCYGIDPHNFSFSETTDFKTFTPLGYFNQGVMKSTNFNSPKHGAVIHLTQTEADRLASKWSLKNY